MERPPREGRPFLLAAGVPGVYCVATGPAGLGVTTSTRAVLL